MNNKGQKKYFLPRAFLTGIVLGIMMAVVSAIAGEKQTERHLRTITVGVELNNPPYSYLAENAAPTGYNVDITRAVDKLIGLNVAIQKETGQYKEIHDNWLGRLESQGIFTEAVLKYMAMIPIALLLLLAAFVFWSKSLARKISQRTQELERQISEHGKVEKALRDSESENQAILDALLVMIRHFDVEMRIIRANRKAWRSAGLYDFEDLSGRKCHEVYLKTDEPCLGCPCEKSLETGKVEHSIYNREGVNDIDDSWREIYCVPVKDKSDQIIGAIEIVQNITDRKKDEEILQRKTHDLGERVKELSCLYCISRLIESRDISLDEILQGVVDLVPHAWQYPEVTCARLILQDQEFISGDLKESPWRQSNNIIVQDRQLGVLDVFYLEEKPQEDEGPFLKEERELINDITERLGKIIERNLARKALRSEHEKLLGVLNAIDEGLYIVNRDYTIEYQNEVSSKIFGDCEGRKCYSVFFLSKGPCGFCPLNEVMKSNKRHDIKTAFPDGSNYDMAFSPFTDIDGNLKVIVLYKAFSEKKTILAEAMRAGHLASLGELAAGVAHEINNPITGIISFAEILKDQCNEQGQDDEIPTSIIEEGERIAGIVKNLLFFARDRKEEHSPVRIGDILDNALRLTKRQIRKDDIIFSMDVPVDLPKIKARSQEIQQVFLNVISNARYALSKRYPESDDGKLLEIKCETIEIESHKYVRTTFYDSGSGIPENIIDRISDPFFSTKPQGEGTGLGLSISHGIIKEHGGRLRFESVEGEFTKVMIDLPVNNTWEVGA